MVWTQHHKGIRFDQVVFVLIPHNTALGNCRVLIQGVFHLLWRQPFSSHAQHVIASALEIVIPVFIRHVPVTRYEPFPQHIQLCLISVVPVGRCDGIPAHQEMTDLARAYRLTVFIHQPGLVAGDCFPGAPGPHLPKTI